jgi:hypothetical protein
MQYFAGSELIALINGMKTRPIALGFTARKDSTRHIIHSEECKAVCSDFLFPIQQGVGISSREAKPKKHLFKTDNRNAFNSLERTYILKEIKRLCPTALPLFTSIF